jgi:hypothetical protein
MTLTSKRNAKPSPLRPILGAGNVFAALATVKISPDRFSVESVMFFAQELHYQCDAGYTSVISREVDLEEIRFVLAERKDRYLENDELVSAVEGILQSDIESVPEGIVFDCYEFGGRHCSVSVLD